MNELKLYSELLSDIKGRVRQEQIRANISANAEMLATYWDVGKMIHQRQQTEGWGKGVLPRLAKDLKNELSEVKGFSERNLEFMVQFYREYNGVQIPKPSVSELENNPDPIWQPSVAKLAEAISPPAVAQLENQSDFKQRLILSTKWKERSPWSEKKWRNTGEISTKKLCRKSF